jgi:hypothetical protein
MEGYDGIGDWISFAIDCMELSPPVAYESRADGRSGQQLCPTISALHLNDEAHRAAGIMAASCSAQLTSGGINELG